MILAIINPSSGSTDLDEIERLLGQHLPDAEQHVIEDVDEIAPLVRRAVAESAELVIASGGDGTVSLTVNELVGKDIPLGILPGGTTNVIARTLGIPQDMESAIRLLTADYDRFPIDTIQVGDDHFIIGVGAGFHAEMLSTTTTEAKQQFGIGAYLRSAIKLANQPHYTRVKVKTASKQFEQKRVEEIMLANVPTIGVFPVSFWGDDVQPDDGRVELYLIQRPGFWGVLGLLFDFLRRRPHDHPMVRRIEIDEWVELSAEPPLKLEGDGDVFGETPFRATIEPHALAIIVPKSADPPEDITDELN